MKKLFLLSIITLLIGASSFAQSSQRHRPMHKHHHHKHHHMVNHHDGH